MISTEKIHNLGSWKFCSHYANQIEASHAYVNEKLHMLTSNTSTTSRVILIHASGNISQVRLTFNGVPARHYLKLLKNTNYSALYMTKSGQLVEISRKSDPGTSLKELINSIPNLFKIIIVF
jgi:hypothetical protein